MSTNLIVKYRLQVIFAIRKDYPRLPKPLIGIAGEPRVFKAIWVGVGKTVTISQNPEQSSIFICKTFNNLTLKTVTKIDLEEPNGSLFLKKFLNKVINWLQ